jgi:hypothetical protein
MRSVSQCLVLGQDAGPYARRRTIWMMGHDTDLSIYTSVYISCVYTAVAPIRASLSLSHVRDHMMGPGYRNPPGGHVGIEFECLARDNHQKHSDIDFLITKWAPTLGTKTQRKRKTQHHEQRGLRCSLGLENNCARLTCL